MEIKDAINLSLARKLYRSKDMDFVNLALKAYSTDELNIPDYADLIAEYIKSKEGKKMIKLQNINYTLAAIAYDFYGNDKNYKNSFDHFRDCWTIINDRNNYLPIRPANNRITDVYFANKQDADRAAYYLNMYKTDGLFDK